MVDGSAERVTVRVPAMPRKMDTVVYGYGEPL